MQITSINFLIFAGLGIILYYIFPVKHRWIMLLIWSLIFYVLGGWKYLPFMLITTVTIYLASVKIGKIYEEPLIGDMPGKSSDISGSSGNADSSSAAKARKVLKNQQKKRARIWAILAIALNIGFLIYGKVMNYLDGHIYGGTLIDRYIIPIGISYYTFATVGYLLDVYWQKYKYEKNFFRFMLFAFYYPHIMQGPISRYDQLGASLKEEHRFSYKNLTYGCERMLWGYFKKLVIADRLNVMVPDIFANPDLKGSVYFMALFLDLIQIYADFSGYMDIVCGLSEIMGIRLEENFNHPFFSRSVTEFWRRWHMTLGGWFRDYVYYPLIVSKPFKKLHKKANKNLPSIPAQIVSIGIPVLVTWILTGLWHGTGSGYLAWGIYYGILILISVVFKDSFQALNRLLHIKTDSKSFRLFQTARIMLIFMGGRLMTKGGSFAGAMHILKSIIKNTDLIDFFNGSIYGYGLDAGNLNIALLGPLLIFIVSMMQNRFVIRDELARQNIWFRWGILIFGFFVIILDGVYGTHSSGSFMYQIY